MTASSLVGAANALARSPFLFLVCALLSLFPEVAYGAPVQIEVSSRQVGIGQAIRVQASVEEKEGDAALSNPRLQMQGDAQVRGPSVGTRRGVIVRNFNMQTQSSVTASWIVTPTKEGKLTVGPVTFDQGGKTLLSRSIVVDVTAQAQGPRAVDPMDILSMRRSFFQPEEAPEELRADKALNPYAFAVAYTDQKSVVVGQPVRVTLVGYGSRGDFQEGFVNEPSLAAFMSHVVAENSEAEPPYRQEIGGVEFIVRKLREYVLIPLKTGELEVGAMKLVIQGKGRPTYPSMGHAHGVAAQTQPLQIQVRDAPAEGRPDGFAAGDVGRYKLKAELYPREVKQGEYVEVVLQILGYGQIPSQVVLPESKDFSWEPPKITGGPSIIDGQLKGKRVLKYAVQMKSEGELDLGRIELPYYDHRDSRYRTARAKLGRVKVIAEAPAPGASAAKGSVSEPAESLEEESAVQFSPRATPASVSGSLMRAPSLLVFWMMLVSPLSLWGITRVFSSFLGFWSRRASTERNLSRVHIAEAKQALISEVPSDALPLVEKALFEALHHSTGVRARGVLLAHLEKELLLAGLNQALSIEAAALLRESEEARFAGQGEKLGELVLRTEKLVKALARVSGKGTQKSRGDS